MNPIHDEIANAVLDDKNLDELRPLFERAIAELPDDDDLAIFLAATLADGFYSDSSVNDILELTMDDDEEDE